MRKQLVISVLAIVVAAGVYSVNVERDDVLQGHSHEVFALAFAPDGRTLASGSGDFHFDAETEQLREYGELKFWDVAARGELATIGSDARFWAVAFSPDGKWAVTGGGVHGMRAGLIQVWDWQNQKQLAAAPQEWLVQSLAICPDGRRLATVSYGAQATLWDLPDLKNPVVLDGHADEVKSVAFSPDGRLVATGSWDRSVKLWDTATAACVRTLNVEAEAGYVSTVAFSPDGKTIAAGSGTIDKPLAARRGLVSCWDVSTGTRLATMSHADYVTTLAFTPDGRRLVSGGRDCRVKVWEAATGRELSALTCAGPIEAVAIAPDGRTLAVAGRERECAIRLWDLERLPSEPTAAAAMAATENHRR